MNKVINTYFVDQPTGRTTYLSGIVLELEDGRFIIHAQDGIVTPTVELANADKYEEWLAQNLPEALSNGESSGDV